MKWIPRPYQVTALSFLLTNIKSGLFLDPGLGKTATVLSAIKMLTNADQIKGVLLIAPMRVCYSVWPNEILKWDNFNDLTHTILHGKTKSALWGKQKSIYLINPEGLPWLYKELLDGLQNGKTCPFDTLVIDESTKFKNPATKVAKSKKPTRFGFLKDMLPLFKRRHIMTGTPAANSIIDVWAQAYVLDEGDALNPNFYKFRRQYFYTDDWDKYTWKLKDNAADAIHRALAPLVLEMNSDDYLELPELFYNYIDVALPSKAMTYYKSMEQQFFIELDGLTSTADAAAQASQRCHQIAGGQVYEDIPDDLDDLEIRQFKKTRKVIMVHKGKREALVDLVSELNGKPLLIGYHYKHDLEAIRSVCGKGTPYIGSGVSAADGKDIERRWNAGEIPVLAGNPVSMAHGINLQEAGNDICWYTLPYSLELYIQFNKRIYRSGVRDNVRIHHLVAKDTLDEAIITRLGERAEQQIELRNALTKYRNKSR